MIFTALPVKEIRQKISSPMPKATRITLTYASGCFGPTWLHLEQTTRPSYISFCLQSYRKIIAAGEQRHTVCRLGWRGTTFSWCCCPRRGELMGRGTSSSHPTQHTSGHYFNALSKQSY